MADYIDREEIKYEQWAVGPYNGLLKIVRKTTIDSIPAADVAPVVRCRDCAHARKKNDYEGAYLRDELLICTNFELVEDGWLPVFPQHFCSYGARKHGDEDG